MPINSISAHWHSCCRLIAGLGGTNPHHWEDITGNLMILSVPTFAGAHAHQLASRLTASATMVEAPGCTVMNGVSLFADPQAVRQQVNIDFRGPTGSYRMVAGTILYQAWSPHRRYDVT